MINNVILVGRVVEDPKLITLDTGYKVSHLVLAVQRPFRNENNEYDTDYIPIQTWMGLAEIVCDYVGKGSIVGFKCRLSTHTVEVGETKLKSVDVIGERMSFIKTYPPASAQSDTEFSSFGNKHADDAMVNSEYVSDLFNECSDLDDVSKEVEEEKDDLKKEKNKKKK